MREVVEQLLDVRDPEAPERLRSAFADAGDLIERRLQCEGRGRLCGLRLGACDPGCRLPASLSSVACPLSPEQCPQPLQRDAEARAPCGRIEHAVAREQLQRLLHLRM